MPVIALTQEMGSLAKDVSLRLAETLGLAVLRHEVVDRVAGGMNVPQSLVRRLRGGRAGLVERLTADRRSIALYSHDELFALAERGNVVLRGWGATALLRPVPHVVCVRITRSLPRRVAWLMEHLGTDDAALAEAEIQRSDRAHASRMHELYGVTWGDPVLYDAVLNTDRLSVETCVETLRALAERPEFAETESSRALLRAMALQTRVRVALKEDAATRDIDITIEAVDGRVTLAGIVMSPEESAAAEQVARGVAGVAEVVNALRMMTPTRRFAESKHT